MNDGSGRLLSRVSPFDGRLFRIDVDQVQEPGGIRAEREIVRHRGSVAAVAVHDDGSIVLVQQYRHAVARSLWELPAGRLDAGETPERGAGRELEEEVGLRAERLDLMADFFTTPGFCDERMFLFRATGLKAVPPRPEPDERLVIRSVELAEAARMIERGEVCEAKTLVAILLELRRREPAAAGRS